MMPGEDKMAHLSCIGRQRKDAKNVWNVENKATFGKVLRLACQTANVHTVS